MDLSHFKDTSQVTGVDKSAETKKDPYLNLLQDRSGAVDKKSPDFDSDAEEGKWYLTRERLCLENPIVSVLGLDLFWTESKRPPDLSIVGYLDDQEVKQRAVSNEGFTYVTKEDTLIQRTFGYTLYCHDTGSYCFYVARSTGLVASKAWNTLRDTLLERMQKELPSGVVAHPYYLKFRLGAYSKPQGKTSFWVPTFEYVEPINAIEYNAVTKIRQNFDSPTYFGRSNQVACRR